MSRTVSIFFPGDYRSRPNQWALPQVRATTRNLERALKKLGRKPRLVKGFITKPAQAIEKLGPIDDPLIGVFVHWTYGPHTTDGVVGKKSPLLLASNFSGRWPGLVGLLNTGACLEMLDRPFSRIWTDAPDWSADTGFMERLDEWCSTGIHVGIPEGALTDNRYIAAFAYTRQPNGTWQVTGYNTTSCGG